MKKYYQQALALGSQVEMCLVAGDGEVHTGRLMQELWRQIFEFERRFSRFLPGSELSVFNRKAGSAQHVSPELRNILLVAKALGEETGGLYNPFILPALQAAGYMASLVKGYEKDPVDDFSERGVADVGSLEIGDTWGRIPGDSAIDLGGCGKGYLADKLAEALESKVAGYWVSLGGDVVAGGVDENGGGWTIGVQSADEPGVDLAEVMVPAGGRLAIATSGTTQRRGSKGGRPWHHLINPRTLKPAETDVRLATVVTESAVRADVLASCAVILGSGPGTAFLKEHGVRSALLQGGPGARFGRDIRLDSPERGR